ncbi:ABC transporter permease [Corynebacterium sp. NML98-0116]|nr:MULTISPECIES: ABC transporter permease [Corynebacterium]AOX06573.1 ABC transporter permease [Corynebacterium sp. NML98-0116]MCQ4613025.1 ABC transporter permease [Corynebacterium sp. CCUG 51687]OIR41273.1 ABC transporter permease [Corynebacterium sp. NML120713]UUA88429.1 ABC transporter permease [Corynebacterium pseudogenitalium]
MFVGLREIVKAKGRFGLIVGTVGLITLLVVMLTGLTNGLGKQNTEALEALDAKSVVFQDMDEPSYMTSRVTAEEGTVPLGTGQTLLLRENGKEESISILGLPKGTELPGGEVLGDGAVASRSLNVAPGDELSVGGTPITVDAVTDDLYFSHTAVLWVNTEDWKAAMHTDADGTVLLASDDRGMSMKDSFNGLAAYKSEQASFNMILGFLYAIAALVIVAFLTVWTMQRTRDLAILKAIGASNSYLRKDALGQAAVLLGIGAAVGALIALGIGLAASKVAPFSLTVLTVAGPPLAIWAIGMVGAFIATRQITKVEPQLALGGIA